MMVLRKIQLRVLFCCGKDSIVYSAQEHVFQCGKSFVENFELSQAAGMDRRCNPIHQFNHLLCILYPRLHPDYGRHGSISGDVPPFVYVWVSFAKFFLTPIVIEDIDNFFKT